MLCAFELFQSTHVVKRCKYCSDLAPSLLCSAGMVAGFVSVSACASTIDSWQAVVIALVTVPLVANVRSICNQINRPECRGSAVDHFVGGCTSLMAAGIFARPGYVTEMNSASTGKPGGVAFGGNGTNLWVQLLALFTLVAWGMLGGRHTSDAAEFVRLHTPIHGQTHAHGAHECPMHSMLCIQALASDPETFYIQ